MTATSLPARVAYAVAAIPAAGALGFYSGIVLLPQLAQLLHRTATDADDSQIFMNSIGIGVLMALTVSLAVLTLPWRRRRKRRGRPLRIVISAVIVFGVSLSFAQQGHALIFDLSLAVWLAYTLTFTFVRYGVLDQARRTADPADAPTPKTSLPDPAD